MGVLLCLIALPAVYVVVLSIRWAKARSSAEEACCQLASECKKAEGCQGDPYDLRYQNPALMFQIITEVQEKLPALQGSLILMDSVSWRQRMRWSAAREYGQIVARAEAAMEALSQAAFFAQFPAGAAVCRNVVLNGIPIRERC